MSGMHKIAVDREREALKAKVNGGVKRNLSKDLRPTEKLSKKGYR